METMIDFTLPNSMIINGIALNLQTLGAENEMTNCQETKLGTINKIKLYEPYHMVYMIWSKASLRFKCADSLSHVRYESALKSLYIETPNLLYIKYFLISLLYLNKILI